MCLYNRFRGLGVVVAGGVEGAEEGEEGEEGMNASSSLVSFEPRFFGLVFVFIDLSKQ